MTRRNFARPSTIMKAVPPPRQHRFTIGEVVQYRPTGRVVSRIKSAAADSHHFTVTRLLPIEGFNPQYRIKNEGSGEERVVVENEIHNDPCQGAE